MAAFPDGIDFIKHRVETNEEANKSNLVFDFSPGKRAVIYEYSKNVPLLQLCQHEDDDFVTADVPFRSRVNLSRQCLTTIYTLGSRVKESLQNKEFADYQIDEVVKTYMYVQSWRTRGRNKRGDPATVYSVHLRMRFRDNDRCK